MPSVRAWKMQGNLDETALLATVGHSYLLLTGHFTSHLNGSLQG